MTRSHFVLLGMLLWLGVRASASPLQLGPWYRDESNGFKMRVPAKWEQIPTKFQEVSVVAKWSGDTNRYAILPECHVLRFVRADATEADAAGVVPGRAGMMRFQPKDVWEYVDRHSWGKYDVVEQDDDLDGVKEHRRAYRVYVQQSSHTGREAERRQRVWVGAMIERTEGGSDVSFGVLFTCAVSEKDDMLRAFRYAIQTFRILDLEEEELEEGEEAGPSDADIFVDSATKPEIWREARRRKLIAGWDAIDTKNYMIVYNKDVDRKLIRQIAKHIEAIRADVYEVLFPPAREVKAVAVVRVCKDRAEYHQYGGPPGSAGYWSRGDEELVFYQDRSNKTDSLRVLYHEAFHQYIHYAVGDVAPHSWFNEGHGDYFSGHNYRYGKFVPDVFRWRTGIISDAIARKSYVPLKDFLHYSQRQYYANPGLCYAQGWSFVYFLREAERRKIRRYSRYWGLLKKYFDAVKRNVHTVQEGGPGGGGGSPFDPPPEEPPGDEPEGDGPFGGFLDRAGSGEAAPETDGLPRPPGLEEPFPGEHPLAGAAPEEKEEGADSGSGETRTVAGPELSTTDDALRAAVDEAFKGIDLDQLEKDWIEFMKNH